MAVCRVLHSVFIIFKTRKVNNSFPSDAQGFSWRRCLTAGKVAGSLTGAWPVWRFALWLLPLSIDEHVCVAQSVGVNLGVIGSLFGVCDPAHSRPETAGSGCSAPNRHLACRMSMR